MKIVAISDNHGNLNKHLPKGDILIIGGDLEPGGSALDQANWLDTTFRKWINKIRPHYKHIILYGGNHSFALESYHYNFKDNEKIVSIIDSLPVEVMILGELHIEGIHFCVNSYCMQIGRWPFGWTEDDYARWSEKTNKCDILLCHGPPYGMLDGVSRWSGEIEHTGSRELASWIMRVRPRLVICNHIHEQYGRMEIKHYCGKTTEIANVAQCDDGLNFKDRPVEIFYKE